MQPYRSSAIVDLNAAKNGQGMLYSKTRHDIQIYMVHNYGTR